MKTPHDVSGAELIARERARQHQDALTSLNADAPVALQIVASLRRTGQAISLGMGASHYANRVGEAVLRQWGVDAFALSLGEALYTPLPPRPRTVLLSSQSGDSVEVERYLDLEIAGEERFGFTLNPESRLARRLPSLIAAGGVERGFAATRSYLLTLALYAVVAEAWGAPQGEVRAVLLAPPIPDVRAAADHLRHATHFVFSARGLLQGVAEVGALGLMELARIPAFALEGGQFRHGPLEALTSETGVVLFRDAAHAEMTDRMIDTCRAAGIRPVVLNAGQEAAGPDAVYLNVGPRQGLAAAIAVYAPLQALLLAVAAQRVRDVGEPLRSAKVTRAE